MDIVPILVSAAVLGSLYALLGSGLALLWTTMGIFNYAHGGVLLVSAYLLSVATTNLGLPLWQALLTTIPIAVGLSVLIVIIAVRPFLKRTGGALLVMVSTLAVLSTIQGFVQLMWGPKNRRIEPLVEGVVLIGRTAISLNSILCIALALVLFGLVILLVRKTHLGRSIRALSDNRQMAELIGVRVPLIYFAVFALAGVLAAGAAYVYGTTVTFNPSKGFSPVLSAFIVLVVGGAGSLGGTLLGAFFVGLIEAAAQSLLGPGLSPLIVTLTLGVFIILRPQGLLRSVPE